jgi:hypothetical protein
VKFGTATLSYQHTGTRCEREMIACIGWFPGRQISVESQLEWRDNRVFLLEPDGSAVAGILFVGEVVPD